MPSNRQQEAARYTAAASISMTDLAEAIMLTPSLNIVSKRLDDNFFKKRSMTHTIRQTNIIQLVSILTSTNLKLLLAIINGTLPSRANGDLRQAVEKE